MDNEAIATAPRRRISLFNGDVTIWVIFFFLCAISLIEVYSATSSLSYKAGTYWDPVFRHAIFLLVGAGIVVVTHNIPCRWFKFYPLLTVPISLFLLVLVVVLGKLTNGAARWLNVYGVSLQPSEIAKGAVIVGVALILSAMQTERGADRHAFKYILWLSVPICLAIFTQNVSTAVLLFGVVVMMMFIGRIPLVQLGKLLGILAIAGTAAFAVIEVTPDDVLDRLPVFNRTVTLKHRVNNMVTKQKTALTDAKDYNVGEKLQEAHASIAIASSNVFGKFPGNSVERDFLPQAFSDFIYAIIIEEMGLFGGACVLMLYVMLLFRASKIANRCERNFPAFLVLGLSLLLVTQAIINMAVAVGLFPVTGQPLPLISRGGSSTLINCVYIGMILSVSRFAKKRSTQPLLAEPAPSPVVEEEFVNDEGIE